MRALALYLSKATFAGVVSDIARDIGASNSLEIEDDAMKCLQEGAEAFLVNTFERKLYLSGHGLERVATDLYKTVAQKRALERVTVMKEDLTASESIENCGLFALSLAEV
jgi:histone H3/H4